MNDPNLALVEIDGGEFETLDRVKQGVAEKQVMHPVLWDEMRRNHRRYGVESWPVSYLIDAEGRVFWEGNFARVVNRPEPAAELREQIRSRLKASHGKR